MREIRERYPSKDFIKGEEILHSKGVVFMAKYWQTFEWRPASGVDDEGDSLTGPVVTAPEGTPLPNKGR